jgi:thiol-disulfide isomerase/thioredoxin
MGDERRKSYRFPPSEGSAGVALHHCGVDYAAKVMNISAEGFRLAIDVESDASVSVGDVALLTTDNGQHSVRVVNLDRAIGSLELGVVRLQDFRNRPTRARRESNDGGTFEGRFTNSPLSSPLVQVAVLIGLAALVLVAFNLPFFGGSNPVEPAQAGEGRNAPTHDLITKAWRPHSAASQTATNDGQPKSSSRSPRATGASNPPTSAGNAVSSPSNIETARSGANNPEPSTTGSTAPNPGVFPSVPSPTSENVGSNPDPIFDAKSDGSIQVAAALKRATREHKQVLVEFGTEKCDSCYRLHDLFTKNSELSDAVKNVVLVSLDFAANQKLASQFVQDGRPLNAPVLAILDQDGKVLKYERADEIDDGRKLNLAKVRAFLQQPSASN